MLKINTIIHRVTGIEVCEFALDLFFIELAGETICKMMGWH
jgi:hypothetical protein